MSETVKKVAAKTAGWKTIVATVALVAYAIARAMGWVVLDEQAHQAVLAALGGSALISLRLGVAKAEKAAAKTDA